MADRTGIEWTDATWNPVRGCTRVSEGCRNCYAERTAARFSDLGQPYHLLAKRTEHGGRWTGVIQIAWSLIDLPLRWRAPRRIFVNSMSDLFHELVGTEEIASIFAVCVAAVHLRKHTMQILTKRPGRMREVMTSPAFWEQMNAEAGALVMEHTDPLARRRDDARATLEEYGPDLPPPGIWLGVSVENQGAADERIPKLLATPAAVRFLSCEPLLGPIALGAWQMEGCFVDWLRGFDGSDPPIPGIDWVIAGGESGPNARPMDLAWARSLRDQCKAAGVAFFGKQYDKKRPLPDDLLVREFPR